jgi:hypothetical protein
LGGEPAGNSPSAFTTIVKGDLATWRKVVTDGNVTVD